MVAASMVWIRNRETLSTAILQVLRSWPELHQRVFVKSHYHSESIGEISTSLGLRASDVRSILDQCDRKLRAALKSYREGVAQREDDGVLPAANFASSGCFH
jgi:DNA-directed RNA polymerase specialized sigma24 family protein